MVLLTGNFFQIQSKEFPLPLKAIPRVSGVLGELRQAHLHRGIDLRTFGQNGLPVYSIATGYVDSVHGSSLNSGFGQALTLRHEDGYKTTYGHLWQFENKKGLEAAFGLFGILARGESFSIKYPERWIKFERGEKIAYTGEKGVGVSHLHYEVQSPAGEYINPLPISQYQGFDKKAASILAIFAETVEAYLGQKKSQRCRLVSLGENLYRCEGISVSGKFGFKVVLKDQFHSINPISVPKIELRYSNKKIFEINLDKLSLQESLRSFKLYDLELSNIFRPFYAIRLYAKLEQSESLPFWLKEHINLGIIDTDSWQESEVHNFEIWVYDLVGNLSRIEIPVQKVQATGLKLDVPFNYRRGQKIYLKNPWIEIKSNVLEKPCIFAYRKKRPMPSERNFITGFKHQIQWDCQGQNPLLQVCLFSKFKKNRSLYEKGRFMDLAYSSNKQAYCTSIKKSTILFLGDDLFPPKWDLSLAYGPLSKLQFYFVLKDGESGVNPNQLEVQAFGKSLSISDIIRWGIYYDMDRKAFVFPTGFFPQPNVEVRGKLVPVSLRGYDRAGNPSKWLDVVLELNLP